MKKYLLAVLASFSIDSNADTEISSCQQQGKTYAECSQEAEKKIIAGTDSLVVRDNNKLILKPLKAANPEMELVDGELQYTLKAHYPDQKISLISVSGWEYFTAYIYHHEYGAYREAFDEIRFSEDGHFLVAFGDDIEAGFAPNAVAIYELGDWPELMVQFQNMNFGVSDAAFISDTEVKLEIYFFKAGVEGYAKGECKLVSRHGLWQFKDVDCAKDAR
ncbi:hypothetical protein PVT68_08935 [Microbulbifer bruguierae]|uniref:Uncharacterized protein n=1 Tax=Microbulbifer bruguierae TaxID=3029061 RepID=A0ABY8NL23_9GAMM|nr:hypothetical protein [Microbulbifer bruguierae]WGL18407.1 hypothetical protein PVT68_08935 [Microbulbifer bruguierae]